MTDSAAQLKRSALNKVLNLFLCFLARALKGPPLHSNANICNLSCVLYVNVEWPAVSLPQMWHLLTGLNLRPRDCSFGNYLLGWGLRFRCLVATLVVSPVSCCSGIPAP